VKNKLFVNEYGKWKVNHEIFSKKEEVKPLIKKDSFENGGR